MPNKPLFGEGVDETRYGPFGDLIWKLLEGGEPRVPPADLASRLSGMQGVRSNQQFPIYAESRKTRTPIFYGKIPELGSFGEGISGPGTLFPQAVEMLAGKLDPLSARFIREEAAKKPRAAYIYPDPDPKAQKRLLSHELIHAALDNEQEEPHSTVSMLERFQEGDPLAKRMGAAFDKSSRRGYSPVELPAYMGAFLAGDVKGVTKDQRNSYMQQLLKYLDVVKPKAGKELRALSGWKDK